MIGKFFGLLFFYYQAGQFYFDDLINYPYKVPVAVKYPGKLLGVSLSSSINYVINYDSTM